MGKYSWNINEPEEWDEYVKVKKKDFDRLERLADYALAFGKSRGINDPDVIERCNKIKRFTTSGEYSWINFQITSSNLHNSRRIAAWATLWINENRIKDRKVLNLAWSIKCTCHYWYVPRFVGA